MFKKLKNNYKNKIIIENEIFKILKYYDKIE